MEIAPINSSERDRLLIDLLARLSLRDRDAFRQLYDLTSGILYGICLRVMKDSSDAEEALQESFVKIWNRAGQFRIDRGSAMAWMSTIARRTAIDAARAKRPVGPLEWVEETYADSAPTPEEQSERDSQINHIEQCLDELDPLRSAAVKAAYLEGDSYQDLAVQFEIPLNTIRTWLRRGLKALRECLQR